MYRYFDFGDSKITLFVGIKDGSPAVSASPEKIRDYFKQSGMVREIDQREYIKLTKKYAELAVCDEAKPSAYDNSENKNASGILLIYWKELKIWNIKKFKKWRDYKKIRIWYKQIKWGKK